MTKQEFIAKYEGWFSYTRREELKKQMEFDLDAVFQALRQPLVSGSLPLDKLRKKLDEALAKETPETLIKWLDEKWQ